jgi:hypothetical protein
MTGPFSDPYEIKDSAGRLFVSCMDCGATVHRSHMTLHQAWHARLARVLHEHVSAIRPASAEGSS